MKHGSGRIFRAEKQPAAFGRLCVETESLSKLIGINLPAAFGRLCVETTKPKTVGKHPKTSRLRAAVC